MYNVINIVKWREKMKYHESQEMYLETILLLKKEIGIVRSIDIANKLEYSRPSVSRAVNLLQKNGYILIDKSGEINFTKEGEEKAVNIYERHHIITNVLLKIGADKETAEDNACRIEHVITEDLLKALKKYLQ
jgi:Mn-dependent DtxR family transcriptional regulator